MASKRRLAARAKRLARKHSQTKPGGASRYAMKRRRFLAGWDNPRSPIRVAEVFVWTTDPIPYTTAGVQAVDEGARS